MRGGARFSWGVFSLLEFISRVPSRSDSPEGSPRRNDLLHPLYKPFPSLAPPLPPRIFRDTPAEGNYFFFSTRPRFSSLFPYPLAHINVSPQSEEKYQNARTHTHTHTLQYNNAFECEKYTCSNLKQPFLTRVPCLENFGFSHIRRIVGSLEFLRTRIYGNGLLKMLNSLLILLQRRETFPYVFV